MKFRYGNRTFKEGSAAQLCALNLHGPREEILVANGQDITGGDLLIRMTQIAEGFDDAHQPTAQLLQRMILDSFGAFGPGPGADVMSRGVTASEFTLGMVLAGVIRQIHESSLTGLTTDEVAALFTVSTCRFREYLATQDLA